jgi:hypothetical protein
MHAARQATYDDGAMIRRAHAVLFCSALAMACGCGGNVVIDGASSGGAGHGGAGHGGAGGQGGNQAGSGGSLVDGGGDAIADANADADACTPEPPPGDLMVTACFTSSWCPPEDSPPVRDALSTVLSLCDTSLYACCDQTILDGVACGPTTGDEGCCYTVFTRVNDPCTGASMGNGGSGPPGCAPNGEICNGPSDCCSGQCNAQGYCGPIICLVEGAPCASNLDCCELECAPLAPLPLCWHCIESGKPCSDAGVTCCSGVCGGGACE